VDRDALHRVALADLAAPAPEVRVAAAVALGTLAAQGEPAIPALLARVDEDERAVADAAAESVARILAVAKRSALDALRDRVDGKDLRPRVAAALVLAHAGGYDAVVTPIVDAALEADDGRARVLAIAALGALGSGADRYLPRLAELANDSDPAVAAAAKAVIAKMPRGGAPAGAGRGGR
jgi:hypothetical protein